MSLAQSQLPSHRDEYRFGRGPSPALQPGTMGWSVDDLNDPQVRSLWDEGRYEIIDGVLTVMPPAYFRGRKVVDNLKFLLRSHFAAQNIRALFSGEVDIVVEPPLVVRADGVVILGEELPKFETLQFDDPETTWEDHPLTLPPTIVIESVSRGHETHDRTKKRRWYGKFKIPNYWIVCGAGRTLECLRLSGDRYEIDVAGKDDECIEPRAFPGLKIPLRQVWEP